MARTSRIIISAEDRASKAILGISRNLKLLVGVATTVGLTLLGRQVVRGVKAAVDVFAEFDEQMSRTRAVTGATASEMALLGRQAQDLGRTTVFTARQAAEAQNNFAKAGFSVNEILSALPGTLALASAGELEVGRAAEISSQLIRTFGLEAAASADIADLLAKAANTAKQTVEDIGQAMKFAGPTAKLLGISVTETSAALSILADRGLQNTLGGTALSKVMSTLLGNVNKVEGAVGLESGLAKKLNEARESGATLSEMFKILRDNGVDNTNVMQIFGQRAGKAGGILVGLGDELEKLTSKLLDRAGIAAQVAGEKLDNLRGDTTLLNSAIEGLQNIIGAQLNPGLRILTQQTTGVVTGFTNMEQSGGTLISTLGDLNKFISRFAENAVAAADRAQIAWRSLEFAFNAIALLFVQTLRKIGESELKLAETAAVAALIMGRSTFGLDKLIGKLRESVAELEGLETGFTMQGEAALDSATATSIALAQIQAELRKTREEFEKLESARKFAMGIGGGEAGAVAAEMARRAGSVTAASADVVGEPTKGGASKEDIAAEKVRQQQILDARERFLEAELSQMEENSLAKLFKMLELDQFRLDAELLQLGDNEEAKRILEAASMEERQQLYQEFLDRKGKASDAALREDEARIKREQDARRRAFQATIGAAQNAATTFFKGERERAIASIAMNTAMAIIQAWADPGYPWAIPITVLIAAAGQKQTQEVMKQKPPRFQGGGIAQGRPGVDRINALVTRGELIADTTEGEARAILGGRAAIVPIGGPGGGGGAVNIFHIQGDVLDPQDWFRRNAQALGRGLFRIGEDGGLD